MIKVLYSDYPKRTDEMEQYINPLCVYELQDIEGGIRVNFHFPVQVELNSISKVDENGKIQEKSEEKVIAEACDKTFDIIFNEHKGHIRNLRVSSALGDYTLCYTDRFDTPRLIDFSSSGNRSNGHYPLLNFSINEDCSEIILYLRNATYKPEYENAEYIEIPNNIKRSYILYLMENSEFCKKKIEHYINKRENITVKTDIYSTITYLESQVDALTRLVLDLLQDKSSDEARLLQEANKYSVLDIKTLDNIENEFKEDKANARKRQAEFYNITV